MIGYPAIIRYLNGENTKLEGSSNTSVQCQVIQMKYLSRRMREFKFVAVTMALLDNDTLSKDFSKAAQNDNDLALDYPTFHAKFRQSLETAQSGVLGSHVKRNLVSLKAGKYASIKLLGMGEDVAAAQDVTVIDPDHYQIEAIVAQQKAGIGHQYFLK